VFVEFALFFFDQISEGVDTGTAINVIYLDFAKAFDKVPHERLLSKLKKYGITGSLLQWIRSWLYNRLQRVCLEGATSEWMDVLSGVPQGSVLGPLFFLYTLTIWMKASQVQYGNLLMTLRFFKRSTV